MEFALPHVIVTVAAPDSCGFCALVAATLTLDGDGTSTGAVYTALSAPFATIVPTVEFPPVMPFTDQIKLVDDVPAPETLAVKACAAPVATDTLVGATETRSESESVTTAEALR
jgi:hypothetical protein